MARLRYAISANQAALLATVFAPGRALRIVDRSGQQQFGTITATTGGTEPFVTLAKTPVLRFRSSPGTLCGLRGNETGALANVVNFIQYDVRNLNTASNLGAANTSYAPLYAESASGPFDSDRTELVRVELDTDGNPIPGTEELVSEYAVNLRFGVTVVNAITGSDPSMIALAPEDVQIPNWAGDSTTTPPGQGPQLVRVVRARLSVRSREADRETKDHSQHQRSPGSLSSRSR